MNFFCSPLYNIHIQQFFKFKWHANFVHTYVVATHGALLNLHHSQGHSQGGLGVQTPPPSPHATERFAFLTLQDCSIYCVVSLMQ